jgi:light-regulated signal transduction histidine kinase (bacteriophytochrome)
MLAFRESFKTLDDTSVKVYVGRVRAKDGNWVWLRNHGKVFNRNESGEMTQYLVISQNITKEKFAEESLTASRLQSDQAINQLNDVLINKNEKLESLDSEIKTISKIASQDYIDTMKTTYIQLEYIILNDARHLSDAGKASIRRAQSGIQKIKLLTEDVVAFTQIPSLDGEPSPVDLNEIVRTVLENMSEKIKEVEAQIVCDLLPTVPGHKKFLLLLFYHLIGNSIKLRIKQVAPVIRIKYSRAKGTTENKFLSKGKYEKISIIDNGISFEPKDAGIIFNIFYRLSDKSKYKGTGVGLPICKKIMDLHNGYITAYGRPGKGSIFNCFFHLL